MYLSVVKDLYNNEIVAYSMSQNNDTVLVSDTMEKLYMLDIKPNYILHTDQGFQYTRSEYLSQVREYNIIPSMSRKGNCRDNSPVEVFFSHLKSETTNNIGELKRKIEDYIWFYNNERIQIKTGMEPMQNKDIIFIVY